MNRKHSINTESLQNTAVRLHISAVLQVPSLMLLHYRQTLKGASIRTLSIFASTSVMQKNVL